MTFYHKEHCPICKGAIMALQKAGWQYEDVLVSDDDTETMEMLSNLGFSQMPVLATDDGKYYGGAAVRKFVMEGLTQA